MGIKGGYILLARKITDSGIMDKPPLYFKLWVWMLEQANHKRGYRGLDRGQFFTTIDEMREAMSWHVGYRKVTPSKKEIRSAYEWLARKSDEGNAKGTMIGTAKGTQGIVITILNYDVYQNPKNYERHDGGEHGGNTKGEIGAQYKQEGEEQKNVNNPPLSPPGGGDADPEPKLSPQNIIDAYHQILPELPPIKAGKIVRSQINARIKEAKERDDLSWWIRFFEDVRASDFLMGRKTDWNAALTWLTGPKNFEKVLNGEYVNKNGGSLSAKQRHNLHVLQNFINDGEDNEEGRPENPR